jgi:hypothetical protein
VAELDINAALGETYEYGGRAPILPPSYYPCTLHVVSTGSSEPKMVQVKDREKNVILDEVTGQPLMEEGGNAPFVELHALVYEGPFTGYEVTRKCHIVTGKAGGALGRWLGACHAITRQHAQTLAVCQKFGVALPAPSSVRPVGKETAETAYRAAVRTAIADGFYAMDAATRLAFIATLLNVVAWDGKKVIVKVDLDEREAVKDGVPLFNDDGSRRIYYNNDFGGFLPLDDEKKGLAWVRAVEFPKQEATKVAMASAPQGA